MIFVSYSRSEVAVARQVVDSLEIAGLDCWLDELNIPVGQAFVERLGKALSEADCFLLVDTPASRSSYWVYREVQTSLRYRKDRRYHSVLRLYSPDCERASTAIWDASVPLKQYVSGHIAEFLVSRVQQDCRAYDAGGEPGSVLFLSGAGLGPPSSWIGRQDELRALDRWWFGSFSGAWLCGIGGTGKSGLLQTWVTALFYLGYAEHAPVRALYLRGNQVELPEIENSLSTWRADSGAQNRLLLLDGYDEARSAQAVEDFVTRAIHVGDRLLVTSRLLPPPHLARYFENFALANMTRPDSVAK